MFLVFALRCIDKKIKNLETINFVVGCIGFLSLLFATRGNFIFISNCWFVSSILILIYITYILIKSIFEGNKDVYILMSAFGIGTLFGTHDLLIHAGILSASRPHLLGFVAPILLTGLAFSMANRFAILHNQSEKSNFELEEMVNQKAQKLIETEKMLVLEKERTRLCERDRYLREMVSR